MLNRAGNHTVGDACKSARGVVLSITERGTGRRRGGAVASSVLLFKEAAGEMEAAELDRDAGADTDEWGEGAFVKGEGAFVAVDAGGRGQGCEVGGGGLKADFDNVKGLA